MEQKYIKLPTKENIIADIQQIIETAYNDFEGRILNEYFAERIFGDITNYTNNTLVQELLYQKLPKDKKPKCQAKVYIGVGKMRNCNKTASHNNKYCFSHRDYK